MARTLTIIVVSLLMMTTGLSTALADQIFPKGQYGTLDQNMERHARQFYYISALPFGLSLDAHAADQTAIDKVNQFLSQTASDDFKAVTGSHPFEILSSYGEYGDLGFFGGVALAGTAYHYMTLKRDGAEADELKLARERLVRAANSWHVFYEIPGGNGVVARGLRRRVPEDPNDPPIPNVEIELTPLADEDGNPLPDPKDNGTYRADNSGGSLPEGVWYWKDSCSKDQLVGQIFAMVALYDAMKDDPDIDQSLVERMVEDARGVAKMLMTKRDAAEVFGVPFSGMYDLIIMDADGRPTFHHGLNPKSIEKFYVPNDSKDFNKFNLIMAIGVIHGLFHVTGDEDIEEFLYNEMLYSRNYLNMVNMTSAEGSFDYIYKGTNTNFDAPDMISIALWMGLYLENDKAVSSVLRQFMEENWWDRPDEIHTAKLCKQPLWHSIYMTLTDQGVSQDMIDETADLLEGFNLGPYLNTARENCDATELEAGQCTAIDGETILTLSPPNSEDKRLSTEALHPSIRPPSNFDSRSNPFNVNGGGGNRINPGGDMYAAYWISRYMTASVKDEFNLSPNARNHMPVGGWPEPEADGDEELEMENDETPEDGDIEQEEDLTENDDEAVVDGDDDVEQEEDTTETNNGDGCNSTESSPLAFIMLLLLALLGFKRIRI